jgi:hypothetical protein
MIIGNAPGMMTDFSRDHLEAPCTFAASIKTGSMFLIPASLLMTEGTKADSQTMKILRFVPQTEPEDAQRDPGQRRYRTQQRKNRGKERLEVLARPHKQPKGNATHNRDGKSPQYDAAALKDMVEQHAAGVAIAGNDLLPGDPDIRWRRKAPGTDKARRVRR